MNDVYLHWAQAAVLVSKDITAQVQFDVARQPVHVTRRGYVRGDLGLPGVVAIPAIRTRTPTAATSLFSGAGANAAAAARGAGAVASSSDDQVAARGRSFGTSAGHGRG